MAELLPGRFDPPTEREIQQRKKVAAITEIRNPKGGKKMKTELRDVSLESLQAHPANPRVRIREDVVEQIKVQLAAHGFSQKHAIHVRPVNSHLEILSGHHRVEAARLVGLESVPAWVDDLDDARAYMELVLSNAQGELSPLERGIHALGFVERSSGGRGKKGGLSEYARQLAIDDSNLSKLVNAARVYQNSGNVTEVSDRAFHLSAIHKADCQLWPILVEALIAKGWSVADTENWVGKVAEFQIPERWEQLFLPLADVIRHFLKTREFSPTTIKRLCAEAERIEAIIEEAGASLDAWHSWLGENKGGDAWDVRKLVERGREIENSLAQQDESMRWRLGNWRDHIGEVDDESVAAVITDPPYGVDYQSDYRLDRRVDHKHEIIENDQSLEKGADELREALEALYPKLEASASVFVFCGWQNEMHSRRSVEAAGLTIRNSLIWVKDRTGMGDPNTTFAPKHERIIFAVKGSPTLFERLPDVLEADRPDSSRHPTEKPEDLLRRLIETVTVSGDLVVDPFGGVASTLAAAKACGRSAWGCELSAEYYAAGANRL